MVPISHDTGGGCLLKERCQGENRFDEIVVLKVLDAEVKSKPAPTAGGEEAMAHSELQGVHDIEWSRTTGIDGNALPQNGYKLSEEIRRSAEFSSGRKRGSQKGDAATISQDVVGKENVDVRTVLEDFATKENLKDATEIPDQPSDLEMKVDKMKVDDHGLRDRVWALEEEKGKLHKDLAAMTLKETILREKVREFELQMDGHRKRVERAEKTILELRQAAAQSSKQARQADVEVEELRLMCARKDGEKQDLQNRVDRLQQLCMDHEKSIHGLRQGLKNGTDGNKEGRMSRLQKELQRLSGAEITLRTELEASRVENATLRRDINCLLERFAIEQKESAMHMKRVDQELRAEIDRGQAQVAELQDENNLLFAKLRLVMRERQETREALKVSKAMLTGIEEENRRLREEVAKVQGALQAKQMVIHDLETQLELSMNNKQMFQAVFATKEKVTANGGAVMKVKDKEARDTLQMGSEMRQSLQAAAQQLYSMNQRMEALMDKLSERDIQLQEARTEIAGKDEIARDLEHTVSNLAKTVDSQSARLMRLSAQNEDLTGSTQSQVKQIEDFQTQIATVVDRKNKAEQELQLAKGRMEDLTRQLQSQDMNCRLLRERVGTLEADLQHCHSQITMLLQGRDDLCLERDNLQHLLADTTLRITDLEHQLADKEEAIRFQEARLEDLGQQVGEGKKELGRVTKERDEMMKEAEAMSREALRTSVEVEVLRRRVHQLDEDVLLRDGQICILRGSMDDS